MEPRGKSRQVRVPPRIGEEYDNMLEFDKDRASAGRARFKKARRAITNRLTSRVANVRPWPSENLLALCRIATADGLAGTIFSPPGSIVWQKKVLPSPLAGQSAATDEPAQGRVRRTDCPGLQDGGIGTQS